jgi:predicted nucleotidyltransferase
MTRDEVLRRLRSVEQPLRRDYAVRSLALFGSHARGAAAADSDVDLLVEFSRPVGLLHLIGAEQYLQRVLDVPKVDLVLRRAVIEELREPIFREAVDVFGTAEVEVPAPAHAGGGS